MTMKNLPLSFFSLLILTLTLLAGCSGSSVRDQFEKPYFELPPDQISSADKDLFERALFRQKNNRIQAAIKVWNEFLSKHPRSFEAHNNLGLVYYEDDQLDPAIAEFETARSLEPTDEKIKKNLIRALKFKSTLIRESGDYNGAVSYLKRAQEHSGPREKERIGFMIEELEDRVYEQVKNTNTLEAYKDFLEKYPESVKNADDARRRIEGLKPKENAVSPVESLEKRSEVQELIPASVRGAPEAEPALEQASAMQKPEDTGEILTIDAMPAEGAAMMADEPAMKSDVTALPDADAMSRQALADSEAVFGKAQLEDIETVMEKTPAQDLSAQPSGPEAAMTRSMEQSYPEKLTEVARSPEQFIETGIQPTPKPSTGARILNTAESGAFDEFAVSAQRVRVVTRNDPLRVREAPFLKSRVITTLEKGSLIPLIKEVGGWYKVEFTQGKAGWISKKFAEVEK